MVVVEGCNGHWLWQLGRYRDVASYRHDQDNGRRETVGDWRSLGAVQKSVASNRQSRRRGTGETRRERAIPDADDDDGSPERWDQVSS